mmetsp:Transcript_137299/g.293341  ORF Transcript_137299/g.293341 Transcript_137299/m.293341 type:complete len:612 (+) Transcript_137299:100-1935(+)
MGQVQVSSSLSTLPSILAAAAGRRSLRDICEIPDNSRPIGKGPFGNVWIAHMKGPGGCMVALKALDKRKMKCMRVPLERILNEVDTLRECVGQARIHQRFVQLLDFVDTPNTSYFVMEFCKGGSLEDAVRKAKAEDKPPLVEAQVAHLMAHVLEGIAYLHSRLICHRDVKPHSVMLAGSAMLTGSEASSWPSTQAKLSGFGLAARLPKGTFLTQKVGTPAFMAPETHLLPHHSPGYDELVDVWAAGAVMAYLFKRAYLFVNEASGRLLLDQLLDGQLPASLGSSSRGPSSLAQDLLQRLLQPDPGRRIAADDARRHGLFRQLEGTMLVDAIEAEGPAAERAFSRSSQSPRRMAAELAHEDFATWEGGTSAVAWPGVEPDKSVQATAPCLGPALHCIMPHGSAVPCVAPHGCLVPGPDLIGRAATDAIVDLDVPVNAHRSQAERTRREVCHFCKAHSSATSHICPVCNASVCYACALRELMQEQRCPCCGDFEHNAPVLKEYLPAALAWSAAMGFAGLVRDKLPWAQSDLDLVPEIQLDIDDFEPPSAAKVLSSNVLQTSFATDPVKFFEPPESPRVGQLLKQHQQWQPPPRSSPRPMSPQSLPRRFRVESL